MREKRKRLSHSPSAFNLHKRQYSLDSLVIMIDMQGTAGFRCIHKFLESPLIQFVTPRMD